MWLHTHGCRARWLPHASHSFLRIFPVSVSWCIVFSLRMHANVLTGVGGPIPTREKLEAWAGRRGLLVGRVGSRASAARPCWCSRELQDTARERGRQRLSWALHCLGMTAALVG